MSGQGGFGLVSVRLQHGDLPARFHAGGFEVFRFLPGVAFGMFFDGKQLPPGMRQTCFAFAGLLHLPVPATGDVRRLDAVLEKEARSTGSI